MQTKIQTFSGASDLVFFIEEVIFSKHFEKKKKLEKYVLSSDDDDDEHDTEMDTNSPLGLEKKDLVTKKESLKKSKQSPVKYQLTEKRRKIIIKEIFNEMQVTIRMIKIKHTANLKEYRKCFC